MATFVSKKREFRIVMIPTDRVIDEQRRTHIVRGKTVQFFNNIFSTEDPETIRFLRESPGLGNDFNELRSGSAKEVTAAKQWVNNPEKKRMDVIELEPGEIAVVEHQRPEDTVRVSPELLRAIGDIVDSKISASLGEVMALLKKDEKKAEKVETESRPKKTFKCPYCESTDFKSPFELGAHKKTCDKKS